MLCVYYLYAKKREGNKEKERENDIKNRGKGKCRSRKETSTIDLTVCNVAVLKDWTVIFARFNLLLLYFGGGTLIAPAPAAGLPR